MHTMHTVHLKLKYSTQKTLRCAHYTGDNVSKTEMQAPKTHSTQEALHTAHSTKAQGVNAHNATKCTVQYVRENTQHLILQ